MKNPFVKEDNTGLIITAVAVGAIAAGAIAYLAITKQGFSFRKKLAHATDDAKEHATDYLQKKSHQLKKKTADLHDIQEIVKG